MSVLDGSGFPPVPADQIETAAALGIGTVVTMQKVADADGKIALQRDRVLFSDAVAGQIIDLGPFADGVGLFPVEFPVILGQRRDALGGHCQLSRPWYARCVGDAAARVGRSFARLLCCAALAERG